MIIAFIIALCHNKCKLQAYVLGNCYKKEILEVTWEPIRNKTGLLWYKSNINNQIYPPLLLNWNSQDSRAVIGQL